MTNITNPALLQAENEKLRGLLRDVEFRGLLTGWEPGLIGQITAALSQQADHVRDAAQMMVPSKILKAIAWGERDDAAEAIGSLRCLLADPEGEDEIAFPDSPEPTDAFTAVDMATAAAQGFRDGQAAVEQAAAQDELDLIRAVLRGYPESIARNDALRAVRALEAIRPAQTAPQHPDDAAVDRFAAAMKAKLAKSRAKGRGGWDDPNVCSVEFLAQLLVEHLGKGNAGTFEDVANFAMMLHQRGADPMVLAEAAEAPIKKARGEALELGVRALESKTAPQPAYVECRECTDCGHVGINDAHQTDATCAMCDWSGPSPVEDQCPDCGKDHVMGAACPKCSGRYRILAETHVAAPIAQTALPTQGAVEQSTTPA